MASKWLTGHSDSAKGSQKLWDPLDIRGMIRGDQTPPDMTAQNTFAALTRQQWDDYLRNYIPIENELINYATNPQTVQDAVMNARADVGRSFDAQQGMQARRLRGLGIDLAPDEQASVNRQTGLARSLADVSAANLTTERVQDRQQSMLGNPAPNIRSS